MKFVANIINATFLLLLLSVIGLFTLPYLPIEHNVELRIVQSGSMEPAISTGSLILVWPQTSYNVGDVITFKDRNASVPTTHRIIETVEEGGSTRFVTQGDANEDPDNAWVAKGDVYGAVAFSLPKAGFVLDFSRQPMGFVLLIVLPALLLIISEIEKIWKELRRRPDEVVDAVEVPPTKQTPLHPTKTIQISSSKMMDIMTPVRFQFVDTLDLRGATFTIPARNRSIFTPATLAVIVGAVGITTAVLATQYFQLGSTYSYFNDTEVSEDNSMTAIALDFSAVADGEVFTFENGQLLDDIDGSVVTSVVTTVKPVPSSEPTRHSVSVAYVSGSEPFCNAIAVDSDDPVVFDGPLTTLTGTDILFDRSWSVGFALPDESGLVNGDICNVELVLSAWHIDEESGEGYSDEERVPLSFSFISPTSLTTGFTSSQSTDIEAAGPASRSALVVGIEEEAQQEKLIADEGQSGDSDDDSMTDTAEIGGEKKPEEVQGEDDDTDALEETGEENEDEMPEEDLVAEEAVKQAGENAEEEKDEGDVAEGSAVEDESVKEDVSETAEGQEEEDTEEAGEAVEEKAETEEVAKEEVSEEVE